MLFAMVSGVWKGTYFFVWSHSVKSEMPFVMYMYLATLLSLLFFFLNLKMLNSGSRNGITQHCMFLNSIMKD